MKKHLILFIFTLITVASMNAQKTPGYVPLASFNKDTLQYLITNFENQKTKYIGKPIGMIFNDLELEIKDNLPIEQSPRNKKYLAGVILKFYNMNLYQKLSLEERHIFFKNMKNYAIYIETEVPQNKADYLFLIRQDVNVDWSNNMKNFYSPYIVKSISANGIR